MPLALGEKARQRHLPELQPGSLPPGEERGELLSWAAALPKGRELGGRQVFAVGGGFQEVGLKGFEDLREAVFPRRALSRIF